VIRQVAKTAPARDDETTLRLRARARLAQTQKANARRYAQHPWPFLTECIWTVDQVRNAVRPFPGEATDPDPHCGCGGCTSYLHHLVNRWHGEPRLLVPKSRRMFATWGLLACHFWLAIYRPNSFIAIVSRKRGETDAEGSAELVKRIKFMHEHLPPEVRAPRLEYQFARIRFPEVNSEIVGIGQGADQLRQYTATAVLFDEFAFWEEAQPTYGASFPTLEGGGRLTIISSANPGFFKQLVHDEQA